MSQSKDFVLPASGWRPRPYQYPLWSYLSAGGKNAVEIAHRRFGKDEISLHHTACAAHERVGSYLHCMPLYSQARKALWEMVDGHTGKRRIDTAFPHELRSITREDEMFIRFKNGSTWQLAGSDNYNALVGTSYVGMVHSEYALSNPAAQGYFAPILMENNGWQIFITTPRGRNHAYDMYRHAAEMQAKGEDYFAELSPASKTGALPEKALAAELHRLQSMHGEEYGKAVWTQEYEVSFDAATPGAIFADAVVRMRAEGRIGDVPHTVGVPVHTGWDLGMTDDTAIWWFQVINGEVRLLHCLSTNNKDIGWYCEKLKAVGDARGFTYGVNVLPHDARPRTLAAGGKSMLQQFNDWNRGNGGVLGSFQIAKRLDKQEQIQAARATLHKSRLDQQWCSEGLEALTQYHREWDDEKKVFKNSPEHDWSSHLMDALMCLSVAWRFKVIPEAKYDGPPSPEQLMRGSIGSQTFGALREAHLRKARGKRESLKMGG